MADHVVPKLQARSLAGKQLSGFTFLQHEVTIIMIDDVSSGSNLKNQVL